MLDTERLEGVYTHIKKYPESGGPNSVNLLIIERVNGNCTISSLSLTSEESRDLYKQMQELGFDKVG